MGVRILDLAQGSPAWHAARRGRYGASELGAIAGQSAYRRAGQVWRSKLGHPEADPAQSLWLEVGHALEPLALRRWAIETGRDLTPGPVLAQERGWLLASLDAWSASTREPVDAKVRFRGSPEWDLWTEGTIPGEVALQLRQQAYLVEGLTSSPLGAAHVAALLVDGFGVEFRAYRLELTPERREEFAELWAPYPGRWHKSYVEPRIPPPDAQLSDVAVAVEPVRVSRREATEAEAELLAQLAELEAERKRAAKAETAAVQARDLVRDALARHLGPDHSIPGVEWRRWGNRVRLALDS